MVNSFTSYEKFLYYDGQNSGISSAPGIGKNYSKGFAVREKSNIPTNQTTRYRSLWGINNVYNITGSKIILESSDVLRARADTASALDLTISYLDQT